MTVKLRDISTASNTAGIDTNSLVLVKPATVHEGDVLIVTTSTYTDATNETAPTGWAKVTEAVDGAGLRSTAWRKIATASEPANYTFTFSSAVSGSVSASLAAFAGGSDIAGIVPFVSGTDSSASSLGVDGTFRSVIYCVYAWRDDAADLAITFNLGTQQYQTQGQGSTSVRRGISATYFGPEVAPDLVDPGDETGQVTASTFPSSPDYGIIWMITVGDKAPDDYAWDDTDGVFDVEVQLDEVSYGSSGGVVSKFQGDVSGRVVSATASSELSGNVAANMLDGRTSTYWSASGSAEWAQYDFGASFSPTVYRYRLASGSVSENLDPMNWELQGSNNGVDFTVLDTRSNEAFGGRGAFNEYGVASPGAYRYYRLNVTLPYDGDPNIHVSEWSLSTIPIWETITPYVQASDRIRITRGLQGTSGRSDYSRAYFTLDNTDGRFSISNQDGAYYGALQRNTPVRISKAYGTKCLQLQGGVATAGTDMIGDAFRRIATDDIAPTGDIDIRIDVEPESWQHQQVLAGVSEPAADNALTVPWVFSLTDEGCLRFDWTHSGTPVFGQTTETLDPANRQVVRVTVDVDDGSGGLVVRFYVGDSMAGPWTQVGTDVTGSFTTSFDYNGGAMCVGFTGGIPVPSINGCVYAFQVRDGIDGTAVVDLDFTAMASGTRSYQDSTGLWIAVKDAVVSNRRYRFHGEVAEWPIAWDTTGTWIYASITGAGPQRRLERSSGGRSALYRHHTVGIIEDPGADYTAGTAYAYWPCEDGKNAFEISSALPDRPAMQIYGGPPDLASSTVFDESNALPQLKGAKFGGRVAGNPVDYADIRFVLHTDEPLTAGANIMTLYTSGVHSKITLDYTGTDTWRIAVYDEDDAEAGTPTDFDTSTVTTEDQRLHVQILMTPLGSDTDVSVLVFNSFGDSQGSLSLLKAQPLGRVYRVNINDGTTKLHDNTVVGHIALYGRDAPDPAGVRDGHRYETAPQRIGRLCREELLEYRQVGATVGAQFMGSQGSDSAFDLMSSGAVSDGGYLVDPLGALGVEYRTLRSALNRAPHLTLDYSLGELSGELLPTADDSYIANDVTISRGEAGSARFRVDDGALSVAAPPEGVGEYSTSQSMSLAHEGQCGQIAGWDAHRGTIDEYHFPRVEIALENQRIAADPARIEAILKLDVGKRVDITNPPAFLPVEDIRQTVIGYEEWFDRFQHFFTLNTFPERAFEVARWDRSYHYDTAGAELSGSLNTADTSFTVWTRKGPGWSSTGVPYDIVMDGEQMTVTDVVTGTVTDSFDRADSATDLGDTDGGNATYTWDQARGTWGISSNEAYQPGGVAEGQAVIDVGVSDFEEVAVTVSAASQAHFVVFRSVGNLNNWCRWGGTVGSAVRFDFQDAGSIVRTETSEHTLADGDRLSVRCNGSVIEGSVNGRVIMTIWETTNEDYTNVGMMTGSATARFNDFAFDFGANIALETLTVTRSVNGIVANHPAGAEIRLYQPPYRGL